MWRYILKRLAQALPVVLGVIVFNFTLIQLAPGDPVTLLVGDYPATEEYTRQVRADFGLDQPVPVRLARYLEQLARGNLGFSFANRMPVGELIAQRFGPTLMLMLTALGLAILIGIPLGVIAARNRGRLSDWVAQVGALAGYSTPDFWMGQLLILIFAVALGWLPSQGMRSARSVATGMQATLEVFPYLILPAFALGFRYIALLSRITRSAMLDALSADSVMGARAKGLSERRVLIAHVLRNAALPIVTVIGYNLGLLIAGSALIETVFSWPGVGRLLFDSISKRDYPVMTAILMMVSITVVIANLITDLVYAALDPRVRYAR
ncbi:MAG: ABC transporter permease [Thermoflexales bacterium]|nr:ABC transporter permease [Thermoflexales bacterium]